MGKWWLHASSLIFDRILSKLLVARTGIKVWSCSILGRISPLILELLALEWWKFHTFELEYLWSQLASLDPILFVASLGGGKASWDFGADWPWQTGLRCAIVALWATCLVVWLISSYGTNNWWAAAWQKHQNDLCAQWRSRSAWTSTQSDQSLSYVHEESLGPYLLSTQRRLIRLCGCAGWSETAVNICHFVGFCHAAAQNFVKFTSCYFSYWNSSFWD